VDALTYGWGDLDHDGYVTGNELGLYLRGKVPQHTDQVPQFATIRDYKLSRGDFVFVAGGSLIHEPEPGPDETTGALRINYFDIDRPSPYMLLVAAVQKPLRIDMTPEQHALFGIDKLNVAHSTLPAITHVDYSARIQTVHRDTNPRYYALLEAFGERTGTPVLVNTSFNVRGEPIVCTPEDAYRCFMRTEMDYLVLENVLLAKTDQPEWERDGRWKQEFELD
jgi:hypothetical protein